MAAAKRPEAWITTVPARDTEGVLQQAYDVQARFIGEPTEFAQVGSAHPELVLGRMEFYKIIDQLDTSLTEAEKHAIIYVTSALNEAPYCASGVRHLLEHGGMPPELIAKLGGELPAEEARKVREARKATGRAMPASTKSSATPPS